MIRLRKSDDEDFELELVGDRVGEWIRSDVMINTGDMQ